MVTGEINGLAEEEVFYQDGGSCPHEIWKVDPKTGEKVRIFHNDTLGFEVNNLVLSPSKEFLIFTFSFYDPIDGQTLLRSGLQMVRPDGSELRTLVETEETNWAIDAPVWSPDSTRVAYLRAYLPDEGETPIQQLHVFSLRTGQDLVITPEGGLCDWSPDGNKIVYASRSRRGIYVVDLASGSQKRLWEDANLIFGWPAWQPGGGHVAITVMNEEVDMPPSQAVGVYLLDVKSQERDKLSDANTFRPRWSPDGQNLLYDVFVQGGGQLWLVGVSEGPPIQMLDKLVVLGTPSWSANGRVVLLTVAQTAYESYWVSIMAIEDRSLARLVLTHAMRPQSTW
jgi:Tol biopolymer transport system component